jgi:hypothetical protein
LRVPSRQPVSLAWVVLDLLLLVLAALQAAGRQRGDLVVETACCGTSSRC